MEELENISTQIDSNISKAKTGAGKIVATVLGSGLIFLLAGLAIGYMLNNSRSSDLDEINSLRTSVNQKDEQIKSLKEQMVAATVVEEEEDEEELVDDSSLNDVETEEGITITSSDWSLVSGTEDQFTNTDKTIVLKVSAEDVSNEDLVSDVNWNAQIISNGTKSSIKLDSTNVEELCSESGQPLYLCAKGNGAVDVVVFATSNSGSDSLTIEITDKTNLSTPAWDDYIEAVESIVIN